MILKDIKGYEGIYKASDDGRIWSNFTHRFLKGSPDKDGYLRVILYHGGKDSAKTRKMYHVHKLIALAFLDNKDNLPVINHKDENKQNNSVSNLEWCTIKYNNTYNGVSKRRAASQKIPVYGYNGVKIIRFSSATDAAKSIGASTRDVNLLCNYGSSNYKRLSSVKGWTFSYTKKFPTTKFKIRYYWYTLNTRGVYTCYPSRKMLEKTTHTSDQTFNKLINTGINLPNKEFCVGRDPKK
ncbi:DNA binding protein [Lactobacillus phage Lbab1]|nr:DNA binding protein [Lactobacillus phage Lbab1]